MVILHSHKSGNNQRVAATLARRFGCPCVAAEDSPDLTLYDVVLIVTPNVGDEELPPAMEDYLFSLPPGNKRFAVCELGNYFGFKTYCGCKKVVKTLLGRLGWRCVGDVSIDSLPAIDQTSLDRWADENAHLFNETDHEF